MIIGILSLRKTNIYLPGSKQEKPKVSRGYLDEINMYAKPEPECVDVPSYLRTRAINLLHKNNL